jgi:hypothetical protein
MGTTKEAIMTAVLAPECTIVEFDPEAKKPAQLDARFRCDSCSAQAYVKVTLRESGLALTFCMHHANQHSDALMPLASEWYSETARLREDRKKGSEN